MSKYICKRRDVCSGVLYQRKNVPFGVFYTDGTEMNLEELEKRGFSPDYSAKVRCRQMLIRVNDQKLAEDLIYDTPINYPILGFEAEGNTSSDFVIDEFINLEELLKYLDFRESLTQENLNDIYKLLIEKRKWLMKNSKLFGYGKSRYNYYRESEKESELSHDFFDKIGIEKIKHNGKPSKYEPGYRKIRKK